MPRIGAPVIVVRRHAERPPYYEAKWRVDGSQIKRRLGAAWVERAADGSWTRKKGRVPDGFLDDRAATVLAAEFVDASLVEAEERRERASRVTFRDVALEWLSWLEHVKGASPATVRDYGCLMREPGHQHKRGTAYRAGSIRGSGGRAGPRWASLAS